MKTLKLSDNPDYPEYRLIDSFYPSPESSQEINRNIFATIFKKKIDICSLEGLFDTTINRYFLVDIKIMEHPLILKNIIQHCAENHITQIELFVHKSNSNLASFYSAGLAREKIESKIKFHDNGVFWKNSLTTSKRSALKKLKPFFVVFAQFSLLCLNKLYSKEQNILNKKTVVWHSFANNREKIDYKFLDRLSANDTLFVMHPNPYLVFSRSTWNKSIYWLGKLSMNPFKFLMVCIRLFPFKKKLNFLLQSYEKDLGPIPENWNADVLQKTLFFLIYNLLASELVETLSKQKDKKTVNIFRGGAAAGLIYSGISKKNHNAAHVTNILITHGTEFFPIDHFSYFYLDYNILPSQKIVEAWNLVLGDRYAHWLSNNSCKNLSGGRIDYAYLKQKVGPSLKNSADSSKFRVGIVLTYNSESYLKVFIKSIIKSFDKTYSPSSLTFIVKPRSNVPFSLDEELAGEPRLRLDKGDIFNFLNNVDLVIGTLSTYGVLTMAVTDAIFCNIPALYYFPAMKFSTGQLGYSFHSSMHDFIFNSEEAFCSFLKENSKPNFLNEALSNRNTRTKEILKFDGDPFDYLERLILTS